MDKELHKATVRAQKPAEKAVKDTKIMHGSAVESASQKVKEEIEFYARTGFLARRAELQEREK